jgi:hypothetical protein
MKRMVMVVMFLLCVLATSQYVNAGSWFFNFNDSTGNYSDLDAYMDSIYGSDMNQSNISWLNDASDFGIAGGAIATAGTPWPLLDFDPSGPNASTFHLTAVSFTWGVLGQTGAIDFGLNVFDDSINDWRPNVFQKNFLAGTSFPVAGDSGLIVFDPTWQITRLRFHDSNVFAVGLDYLMVTNNPVPEASTLLLLGSGLASLAAFRKRFREV